MKLLPPAPPTTVAGDYSSPGPADAKRAGGSLRIVRRFLVFLRRFWWIPVVTLLLGVAAEVAVVVRTPPVFVSAASLWETEKLQLSQGALFKEDPMTYIGTQIELLKSERIYRAALDRVSAAVTNGVPRGKDGLPLPVRLDFKDSFRSQVFGITATSADPDFSRNFLNAVMAEYLEYKKSVRESVSGNTEHSISKQVEEREKELKKAEEGFTAFQHTNNLAILQEEGSVAGSYLAKLQTELSDLQLQSQITHAGELERNAAPAANRTGEADQVAATNQPDSSAPTPARDGQLSPNQDLELLLSQRDKLTNVYRPKHPKMVALESQISRAQKIVELTRRQSREQQKAAQDALRLNIASVQNSIKEWNEKLTHYKSLIAEAERMKQDLGRVQSAYDRLFSMLENIDISRQTDLETMAVLEPASEAVRVRPGVVGHLVTGFLLGLLAGCGIVFLLQRRDDRFTSVTDVNFALGDAVVAMVPKIPRNGEEPLKLLEPDDSRHGYAESYRNLRSALLFQPVEGARPKVLLITSAVPNEGKSTVAANLGRTLALAGARVLLVDADLRRGVMHRVLALPNQIGLTELLNRGCAPQAAIQNGSLPNFFFVSRGARAAHPGDLFLGTALDELLAQWRRDFDFVLIDSSPVFAADDTSCLAPKVDGTLFVVREGCSKASTVTEALGLLAQRQARILGVVYNGADSQSLAYQYYKYAEYQIPAETA